MKSLGKPLSQKARKQIQSAVDVLKSAVDSINDEGHSLLKSARKMLNGLNKPAKKAAKKKTAKKAVKSKKK